MLVERFTRLTDLILGTHPKLRSRIRLGLVATIGHLGWILLHWLSVNKGFMTLEGAMVMSAINLIGAFGFYPWVRSGFTAHWQDSGMVQAQVMYAAATTVLGYSLNITLGVPVLESLCMVHMFALFSLRPVQLMVTGGATMLWLISAMAFVIHTHPSSPQTDMEVIKLGITCFIVALITWMSILHSKVRGRLSKRKKELALAVNKINELVTHDALTGLFNRKHMQELLEHEHHRLQRNGQPFCVALIDLDHFKQINDRHGHAVGDEVLCSFAKTAQMALRETDVIARWGGEEFLVLMPETTSETDARVAIERLRDSTRPLRPLPTEAQLRYTFSVGIALHSSADLVDQTIHLADQALYAAKHGGRDRVVLSQEKSVVVAPELQPVTQD